MQSTSRHWLGRDFQIVTFAIGPEDTVEDAHMRGSKARFKLAKGTHDADSWHFLTGSKESIERLTTAIGYRYTKDGDDYAHPAVIMIATPGGSISRYLYGLTFASQDIELGLSEATLGTINDRVVDRILLYCYKYDPIAQEYVVVAQNIMQIGGYITLVLVGGFVAYMLIGERRKRQELRNS